MIVGSIKIDVWKGFEVDFRTVLKSVGTCDELDDFVSIPDEGVMAFLRKKVKSGAAVEKRVLLQVHAQ
ncbi:hypothetical protein Tco_0997449 [Tanacetum coccineum]